MKCLVTGAGGFIGSYLVERLLREGAEVTASGRRAGSGDAAGGALRWVTGDIREAGFVEELVRRSEPEVIFHLAAQSFPVTAWREPENTCAVNVVGTVNLLEAVRRLGRRCRVVVAGSSAEYAPPSERVPIGEDARREPSGIYGMSKVLAEDAAAVLAERHGLEVVYVRPFFLIGPRKEGDVCSDFARGVVRVERGDAEVLEVGDTSVVRDFLDVRDGVEGMLAAAFKGTAGVAYNICSGSGVSLREVLEIYLGLARVGVEVRVDEKRLRPLDEPWKVGDPARLRALGWRARRALPETLAEILEYWRGREGRA